MSEEKAMTIKELKLLLNQFSDDAEVSFSCPALGTDIPEIVEIENVTDEHFPAPKGKVVLSGW